MILVRIVLLARKFAGHRQVTLKPVERLFQVFDLVVGERPGPKEFICGTDYSSRRSRSTISSTKHKSKEHGFGGD